MNDIVLGMATGYGWEELQPWVISLRETGYKGEAALFIGNAPGEPVGYCPGYGPGDYATRQEAKIRKAKNLIDTKDKLTDKLSDYDIYTVRTEGLTTHPSIARGKTVSMYINALGPYRYAVVTDTKDVVFQSDPITWLSKNLNPVRKIAIQSEGMMYQNSPGNLRNVKYAFGLDIAQKMLDASVLNAGVIAGDAKCVADFCNAIYELSLKDERLKTFTPGYEDMLADQSAMNILSWELPWINQIQRVDEQSDFVSEFHHNVPRQIKDGIMLNPKGEPYCMWHQWMVNGDWWRLVKEKYRDASAYFYEEPWSQ